MNIYSLYLHNFYQVIYIFSISLSFLSHLLFFPCAFLSPVLTFSIFLLYTNRYLLYDYIFWLFLSLDNSFFSLSFPFLTPFAFFLPFCQSFFYRLFSFIYLTQFNFAPHCKQRVTSPASSLSPPTFWTTLAGGNFATDWIFMCLLDS